MPVTLFSRFTCDRCGMTYDIGPGGHRTDARTPEDEGRVNVSVDGSYYVGNGGTFVASRTDGKVVLCNACARALDDFLRNDTSESALAKTLIGTVSLLKRVGELLGKRAIGTTAPGWLKTLSDQVRVALGGQDEAPGLLALVGALESGRPVRRG